MRLRNSQRREIQHVLRWSGEEFLFRRLNLQKITEQYKSLSTWCIINIILTWARFWSTCIKMMKYEFTVTNHVSVGQGWQRPCADIAKLEQEESCWWDFNRGRHLQVRFFDLLNAFRHGHWTSIPNNSSLIFSWVKTEGKTPFVGKNSKKFPNGLEVNHSCLHFWRKEWILWCWGYQIAMQLKIKMTRITVTMIFRWWW